MIFEKHILPLMAAIYESMLMKQRYGGQLFETHLRCTVSDVVYLCSLSFLYFSLSAAFSRSSGCKWLLCVFTFWLST